MVTAGMRGSSGDPLNDDNTGEAGLAAGAGTVSAATADTEAATLGASKRCRVAERRSAEETTAAVTDRGGGDRRDAVAAIDLHDGLHRGSALGGSAAVAANAALS